MSKEEKDEFRNKSKQEKIADWKIIQERDRKDKEAEGFCSGCNHYLIRELLIKIVAEAFSIKEKLIKEEKCLIDNSILTGTVKDCNKKLKS